MADPVLVEITRGNVVESVHRGALAVLDAQGRVVVAHGDIEQAIFPRSAVKGLQALPLIETGAADRYGLSAAELALACASHSGEPRHVEAAASMLAKAGRDLACLECGTHWPSNEQAARGLAAEGRTPSALHNNCSGKHTGFLALALHLGVPVAKYIEPDSAGQVLVRKAVLELTGVPASDLGTAVDGCSAPTFRMPLSGLATAFARVANPSGLPRERRAACERMLAAVAAHPHLIAGHHQRIDTDIARVTRGRLFPKIGGEAVYAIGVRGSDRGLALKIDDGSSRALHALVVDLLRRFSFATADELAALEAWEEKRLRNWAGLDVGRTEVVA